MSGVPPPLFQLQHDLQIRILTHQGEIAEVAGANAHERIEVYTEAYRLRLLEVLQNDYPGLHALAGAEDFESACVGYISAQPSRHFNARWYGAGLATFLRATAPWDQHPEHCEMAEFEWALTLAFDAADQPCATEAGMAALSPNQWPDMRPTLLCACLRRSLAWNVADIRKAAERNQAVPPLTRLEREQDLLIWRKERTVRYRAVEPDEAAALDALGRGASFTDLCELLCDWHPAESVAVRAAQMLHRWVADQCLVPLESVPA